jgi:cephalosporin hydroxylase
VNILPDFNELFMNDTRVKDFHALYYNSNVWTLSTSWLGNLVQKCPTDLWIYQEIIFSTKPDLIIETGSGYGGGTLFLANMLDIIGSSNGKVISIDIIDKNRPKHDRIAYINDTSISDNVIKRLTKITENPEIKSVMVILDSDHSSKHVANELEKYYKFVTKDNYLIIEDTNINPILPDGIIVDGPYSAVQNFIKIHNEFIIDLTMHKHLLTFNPFGYLKKVAL